MNRDPAVVASLKEQLTHLSFTYTAETSRIVRGLSEHPLLVERRWNTNNTNSKPYFLTHEVSGASQSVSVDAEVCGITLAPEHNATLQGVTDTSRQAVLEVADPEIRISRRPASKSSTSGNVDDDYFQSQAIFYLVDRSGGIPSPLKVQCNRPHFLVGNGLVEFASQAICEGLKLTPERDRTVSLSRTREWSGSPDRP
jgi:hypothetical protein